MTLQANLTNRDATRMPHPLVKSELRAAARRGPPARDRPGDVPGLAAAEGPAFVSIPMDDSNAEVDEAAVALQTSRTVVGRAVAHADDVRTLADRRRRASNPALVAGPDLDSEHGRAAAVALAEAQGLTGLGDPGSGAAAGSGPRGPSELRRHPAARRSARWARRSPPTTWSIVPARRCSPTTRTSRARCWPRARRCRHHV